MDKKKRRPGRGGAVEKANSTKVQQVSTTARPCPSNPPTTHPLSATAAADSVDLPALRDRLLATRARLLEQVANDWGPGRRYPDTSWCRMLADVQGALQAVDAVMGEAGP